jgi:hypothetical protein
MAIKALFQSGNVEALTDSLYQWDYGQELEIEAVDLGTQEIEVHFACPNMTEAIVKPCYLAGGIGVVSIPDDCLEQSSTITAWIYEIVGTQGRTRKVVKIPVIARTRPSVGHDIPTEICDRYTELITDVNEALGDLENGNIVVKKATTAESANSATTAGNASTANYAVSAASADSAGVLKSKTVLPTNTSEVDNYEITSTGLYVVMFKGRNNSIGSAMIAITDLNNDARGTSTEIGVPVYEELYKTLTVYTSDSGMRPITALYRIADI